MATFVVILSEHRPVVEEAIKASYPDYRRFSPTIYFLKGNSPAQEISRILFDGTGTTKGASVFRVTADYYGYAKADFWEWLSGTFTEPES